MTDPAIAEVRQAATPARAISPLAFRDSVRPGDVEDVGRIVRSTGFFSESEAVVAVELVQDRLNRGRASDYHFVFFDEGPRAVAYACFGPIACTTASYDLYWIAVDAMQQGGGLGRALLHEVERRISAMGGRRVYIETSGREQYAPTRRFYERCGYTPEAVLRDFYAPGDDKVVYLRAII